MQNKQLFIEVNSKDELTCRVNSIRLHSKYNPKLEAERNINQQLKDNVSQNTVPKLVIMVGAGLGYELEVLNNKFPNVEIFPIYFDKILFENNKNAHKALFLNSHNEKFSQSLKQFFITHKLSKLKQSDVLVLFWPPSTYIWKENTLSCLKEVKEIINHYIAEEMTVQHFVAQWIRNASFHYLHIDNWHLPEKVNKNIIVVGAGPSLNRYIGEIQLKRPYIAIIAVSSALKCLFENNIFPDIIVHQDSGYYASEYLTEFPKSYTPYIAFPLHASRSSILRKYPSIILNTGQEIESLLNIGYLNSQSIHISPHATVFASALELAWKLSTKTIYLAGFDLNIEKIGNHCFPHIQNKSFKINRLQSLDNQIFDKILNSDHRVRVENNNGNIEINQNRSLKIYSDWFRRWNPREKTKRSVVLGDNLYPHQKNMNFSSTINIQDPHSNENKLKIRKPNLKYLKSKSNLVKSQITSQRVIKFDKDKRKNELDTLVSKWEQTWKEVKNENKNSIDNQSNISKPNMKNNFTHTIKSLQNTISDDVFDTIISSVKNYLK